MINVLWLEDNAAMLRDFFNLAKQEDVNLILKENSEDAKTMINLHDEQIDAAILDARGFRCSSSEQASTGGMHEVRKILESKLIPFAIFSGEANTIRNEEFINAIGNARVFEKGRDEMTVLDYIKDAVKDLPNVKVKQENKLAFSVFSIPTVIERFGENRIYENEQILIKLIRNKEDVDVVAKCIRSLYEGFIFQLFEGYCDCFKREYKDDGSFNFNRTAFKLENKKICQYVGQDYIGKLACMTALYSQSLNHDRGNTIVGKYLNETGDPYYIPCLINGMLSVMTWLPEFIRRNQNRKNGSKRNGTIH